MLNFIKKIWRLIVGAGYTKVTELINSLDNYEDDIAFLIKNVPADKVAKTIIDFIQKKLQSLANEIFEK